MMASQPAERIALNSDELDGRTEEMLAIITSSAGKTPLLRSKQLEHAKSSGKEQNKRARKALTAAVVFCFVFMCVEFAAGLIANSLAVLTDAAHLLTDVGALSLALFSIHASSWQSNNKYSFGWHRAEVIGALGSVFTIWALVGGILYEAVRRLVSTRRCASNEHETDCEGIDAPVMLGIGVCGLLVNLGCAAMLMWGGHHGHSHGGLDHGHGHCANDGNDDCDGHSGCSDGQGMSAACNGSDNSSEDELEVNKRECTECATRNRSRATTGAAEGDYLQDYGLDTAAGSSTDCRSKQHEDRMHGHSHGHGHGNLNVRGAFLHALGDCIQSLGVIIAAAVIWIFNNKDHGHPKCAHSYYNLADPLCSILFGVITLFTTKRLFGDLLRILMECTPAGINYDAVLQKLNGIACVESVHDLHIWSLTAQNVALSVHLVSDDHIKALKLAQRVCTRFGIKHATIQVDPVNLHVTRCASDMHCCN